MMTHGPLIHKFRLKHKDRTLFKVLRWGAPDQREVVYNWNDAHTISSYIGGGKHKPVIDIDLPVELYESTTPGHYHLYIDKPMSWDTYRDLLVALEKAGIIEHAYLQHCLRRGDSSVRLPWIEKKAEDQPGYYPKDDKPTAKIFNFPEQRKDYF